MSSVSELVENYHHGNDLSGTSTLTSAVILERSGRGGLWVMEGGGVFPRQPVSTQLELPTHMHGKEHVAVTMQTAVTYIVHTYKNTHIGCAKQTAQGPWALLVKHTGQRMLKTFPLACLLRMCVCFQMFQYLDIKLGPLVQSTSQAGLSELIYKRTFIH